MPEVKKLNTEEEAEVVKFVLNRFETLKRQRAGEETKWERRYKRFSSWVDETTYPFISHVFVPESFSLARVMVGKLIEYLFSTGRVLECEGGNKDSDEAAKRMEALQLYQYRNMKLEFILIEALGYAVPIGTALLKTRWKKETRKMDVYGPADVEGHEIDATSTDRSEQTVYDDIWADVVDPWDFYINPAASDVQDAGGLIHAYDLNEIELRRKGRLDGWENTDLAGGEEDGSSRSEEKHEATGDDEVKESEEPFVPVGIVHYWGPLPKEIAELYGGTEDDEFEVVVSEKRRKYHHGGLNVEPHGKRPFVRLVIMKKSGRFYGDGLLEAIGPLQDELNDLYNHMTDLMAQEADPPIVYPDDMEDAFRNYVHGPGGRLSVEDPDAVKFERPGQVSPDLPMKINMVTEKMYEVTGLHKYEQGMAPTRAETATGIISLQRAAATKTLIDVRLIEALGLEEMADQFGALNMKNVTGDRDIREMKDGAWGWSDEPITPDGVRGKISYTFLGSVKQEFLNRTREAFAQLYGLLKDDPGVNQVEIKKMLLEAAGEQNFERFLKDPLLHMRKAAAENLSLARTGEIGDPDEEDDHKVHVQAHGDALGMLEPALQEALAVHIEAHQGMMGAGVPGSRLQVAGSGAAAPRSDEAEGVREAKREIRQGANTEI